MDEYNVVITGGGRWQWRARTRVSITRLKILLLQNGVGVCVQWKGGDWEGVDWSVAGDVQERRVESISVLPAIDIRAASSAVVDLPLNPNRGPSRRGESLRAVCARIAAAPSPSPPSSFFPTREIFRAREKRRFHRRCVNAPTT